MYCKWRDNEVVNATNLCQPELLADATESRVDNKVCHDQEVMLGTSALIVDRWSYKLEYVQPMSGRM